MYVGLQFAVAQINWSIDISTDLPGLQ